MNVLGHLPSLFQKVHGGGVDMDCTIESDLLGIVYRIIRYIWGENANSPDYYDYTLYLYTFAAYGSDTEFQTNIWNYWALTSEYFASHLAITFQDYNIQLSNAVNCQT